MTTDLAWRALSCAILACTALVARQASPERPAQQPPHLVGEIEVRSPAVLTLLDTDMRGGQPTRLAWSPDATELYVRMSRTDRWGNERNRHFLIAVTDGGVKEVDQEPTWAATSWTAKSSLVAPGAPDLHIAMEVRNEHRSATGANPFHGRASLEPATPGVSALQRQSVRTTTLTLKGHLLGRFENVPAVPGMTYGWGASGSGLLAYSDDERRLFLLDREGHRRAVAATREAWLPAWSPDLSRLAILDRAAKNKYEVKVFEVCAAR